MTSTPKTFFKKSLAGFKIWEKFFPWILTLRKVMEYSGKSSSSWLHLAFSSFSGRVIQSLSTELPCSWEHAAHGCLGFYCMNVSCFTSLLPDPCAFRVFPGFCSFKPSCFEFPYACIISQVYKHICKVNSYMWICWVQAYGDCLFRQQLQNCCSWTVDQWFSPFLHITEPASPCPPCSNVGSDSPTLKNNDCGGDWTSLCMFKCLAFFFFIVTHLFRFFVTLLVFHLWVVGTPYILRKLSLCIICGNFSLCVIYLLNMFMA